MSLYPPIQEPIGNTPLMRLSQPGFPEQLNVYAKSELYNPVGSVKDRIGRSMTADAESRDILKLDSAITEVTASNTGSEIASVALNRGYRPVFVAPQKSSQEKQTLIGALGAEVIRTPTEEGTLSAARKAEELCTEIANPVFLEQFKNQSNPQAHYEAAGSEIYRDLDGKIGYVVAGVGNGGTYTGVLRYLKERNPAIKGVLVGPIGSTIGGGEHSSYGIEGIGNDFIADTTDMSLVDQVTKVSDAEAFEQVRIAAKKEGIFADSSSGAALAVVNKLTKTASSGTVIVIPPDRGGRYSSKHILDEQTLPPVLASAIHRQRYITGYSS